MKNFKRNLQEIDENFHDDLKEVQRTRVMNGRSPASKPEGVKRLTRGIHNHPLFKNILTDLKRAELPKKRGNVAGLTSIMAGILIFIIVTVIIVFISAVWVNTFGTITDDLTTLPNQNNVTNVSQYADTTFGNLNTSFQALRWISVIIIFGMLMGIILSAFLVKIHPAFFIFYIFIVVMLIFVSIIIANAYETVYQGGGTLGDSLQAFKSASWIVLYLPIWITLTSIVGGILLFITMKRDDSQGALV